VSVQDEQAFKEYDCDGATTQFPITFSYLKDEYLYVRHYDDTTTLTEDLTLDIDYTIVSDEVVTTLTYPTNDKIYLSLDVPNSQEEVLYENGQISSNLLNFIHDKLTLLTGQNDILKESALRLEIHEDTADMTLPNASARADTVVIFDSSGDADVATLVDLNFATITDFCAGVLESNDADEFREAVEQGTILSGTSDPTIGIGVDNDFYINISTLFFFGPKSTTWPAGIDMNGTDGTNGTNGTNGEDGADGADGLGVPAGGVANDIIVKQSATENDTAWDQGSGSGIDADKLDGIEGTNYTREDLTQLGKDSVSLTVLNTAADWAALPVGFSGMISSAVGTAKGAPVNNYGYFTKTSQRDTGGGWGGLWVGYSAGENYSGRTATDATFATWDKMFNSADSYPITTVSTSAPSGGSDGDVWLTREA